jgi:hypothetical protein
MKRYIIAILALACAVSIMPRRLSAACVNPPQGLVSWWPGEGNANDIVESNSGTASVGFSPGEVGQAFNFAGTGAVVVAASGSLDVGTGSGFSIECWIRPNDLSTRRPLLEWRNGSNNGVLFSASDSACGDSPAGNLFANIIDASGNLHPIYSGPGLLTTSNFQHVAVTYNHSSGVATLYINGAVVAKANAGTFTPQTSYPLYIGQSVVAGNLATFSGSMDEVSLYGRELSQSEVRSIYAVGVGGKCHPAAPFIVTQPASQLAAVGGNASFSVVAGGTQPLSYQWRRGTNALTGATNSVLNLSNVQFSDAGNYSVIVANVAGSVTSSNALLTVSTGGCAVASSSLVSWWPAEGNGNDVQGNNPGTVNSGVSYSPGEVGQAFNFEGNSGTIVVPASSTLNVGASGGFSVECWIKPSDVSVRHPIVEWNNGSTIGAHFYVSHAWFGSSGPGNLMANIEDTGGGWHPVFSAPGLVNTNSFQHVALTYDKASGVGTLYLNGAVVASANLGTFTPQTSFPMYVGQRPSDSSVALYSGLIDELSVYGKALSQAEVQAIYTAGASGKCQSSSPPFIVTQPANQTTSVGGSASFSVTAGGSQPLSYQWWLGTNALNGATSSVLNLSNVQLTDAGNYSVVVSNAFGTVTSTNALLTVNTGGCVSVPGGIVSWWPAEGNGTDVAGNNPGNVKGGVGFSVGEVGQAFNFNGTSGTIVVPASNSLNVGSSNGFSVECWIKPSDVSVRHPIVEWNNGSSIGVHFYVSHGWYDVRPGDLMANIEDTGGGWHPILSAAGLVNTNSFQHVALTYDKGSGTARLYLNGAVVASENLGNFTPQTSFPMYVGQRPSDGSVALYSGLMDELSLYERALSPAEIQAIYNAGTSGKCQGSSAPLILTQPANQTTAVGGSASFSVTAGGSQPLSYQWRLGTNALNGATNSVLNLSNVQLSDAGNYSVVVSNPFGTVTSSNALLTVNTGGCVNVPGGIVSWWPGEGNGADVAGNNPGTVNGGTGYSAGEVGQSFSFNGTSGKIIIAASGSMNVGLSNGFSVECWIKPAELSVRHPIVEWSDGSNIGVHFYVSHGWFDERPGDLLANIEDTGGGWHPVFTAAGLLNTNSFQHVALTYDKASGVGKLYLNGAVVASENLGSFTPQTSFPMYIGQRPSDSSVALYSGLMDELSVYGRALSQTEIQAIYDASAAGKCQSSAAPFILNQPTNQAAAVAGSANFSVTAGGTQPLSYQWRHGTNALTGATSSVLNLTNVQLSDAGNYSAVVSNAFGTVTSSNALLTVNTGGCVNVPGGIVSWWPAEGNGNDVAGSNPGTVSGGVSYSAGEVGQSFNFNGTSGTILVPASGSMNVGLSNGFTVECWIKPSDLSQRHPIVEWGTASDIGVHFYVSHGWFDERPGNLMANVAEGSGNWHPVLTEAGLLNTNTLQHVALTYDKASGVGKLFLNGAVVASENLGNFTPQTSFPMYVGQRPSDSSVALYSGLMDELSLYARALSLAEIQAIYNAGASGKCSGGQPPIAIGGNGNMRGTKMLQPVRVSGGYRINFAGTAGGSYVIQRAPSVSGPWTTLTTVAVGTNGAGSYIDRAVLPGAAFYRTVTQ